MKENTLRVAMLSTGEELLLGDITDTNATWLSSRCFDEGFSLHRRVTVGDGLEDIAVELVRCSQVSDVVIVNGGLGPTGDDVTTQAMSMAMNVDLELNNYWLTRLKERFEKNGRVMPKSNIKQAMLPDGATLIDNPVGSACGFSARLNDCLFFFTPGVPFEFKLMFDNEILPQLQNTFSTIQQREIQRLYSFGLSESFLNDKLEQLVLPDEFALGYRSALPFIEIKVFSPAKHSEILAVTNAIRKILGAYLIGDGQLMLPSLGELLHQTKQTLAVAEKFTGGYIANWLQQTPTTQAAFTQGWVLSDATLEIKGEYNPLSAVLAMAAACRFNAGATIGLASGSIDKGQVALGFSTDHGDWGVIVKARGTMTTDNLRCYVSTLLLDMVRRDMEGHAVFYEMSSLETLESIFIPVDEFPAS